MKRVVTLILAILIVISSTWLGVMAFFFATFGACFGSNQCHGSSNPTILLSYIVFVFFVVGLNIAISIYKHRLYGNVGNQKQRLIVSGVLLAVALLLFSLASPVLVKYTVSKRQKRLENLSYTIFTLPNFQDNSYDYVIDHDRSGLRSSYQSSQKEANGTSIVLVGEEYDDQAKEKFSKPACQPMIKTDSGFTYQPTKCYEAKQINSHILETKNVYENDIRYETYTVRENTLLLFSGYSYTSALAFESAVKQYLEELRPIPQSERDKIINLRDDWPEFGED